MKSIRDWVFTQLVSKSLASSRPLTGSGSFFSQERSDEDSNEPAHMNVIEAASVSPDTSFSSNNTLENGHHPCLQQDSEESNRFSHGGDHKRMDPLAKIEALQIKFFRLLQRLGHSHDNLLAAKVLYRLHLAASIRAGETDSKRVRKVAAEQEAIDIPKLNYSMRILVLGKTGVGKSATINSVFDQTKTMTNAFEPATSRIQEIVGTVKGIKVTFIDTPGFLPSSTSTVRRNRKMMLSVKKFISKYPPDIVLFFERLDLVNLGYSDFPLLTLMTEVFGSAIWFNTVLVMTHAAPTLPEGPNGYPVNYESYVTRCTDVLQHYIHQAVSDAKLENPVLLVENHPQCKKNFMGESILPNGQAWKSQVLLLCICNKILGDASTLLEFQDSIKLGSSNSQRMPSLPHLLSSVLQHRSVSSPNESEHEVDGILLSDADEEDEYDQLPPIRILTKSQFERLTKSQKRDYLDELDYRETLYLKKQLKEDARRRREKQLSDAENFGEDNTYDDQQASPEAVLLPDMAVPPSFDSDCPVHRYRCLATSDQWLVRPVLDPQGWDHDVGFDGINLETAIEVKRNIHASIVGQMTKDKQHFSIQSECAAAYKDPKGPTYSVGFDVQSSGKDLIYTVHSDTKLRILRHNIADCAVSLTSFGNKYYVGAKLEDAILIGKRLKFVMNAGQMRGPGQVAYGGTLEATLKGRDYPVRNDSTSLSMTALSFKKEMVLGGGFQSQFRPILGMTMAVNANLNSQKMGKVSIKLSSSEHTEIALIAIFSIFRGLLHRKEAENGSKEALEM
ncbi:translocase of chloroplast 90, chloroplastic isoform X2 [Ricinus communis]|uniref:translocase of chloroplast 90, chloroplastic isoform X2 n=1 Tax=Ricinus communis TaxID=3988 RepID=UPI0007725930|nr:translocase of chloroplast 90, chloroplastic isoform X2 [Ricinus communis]|eukprot:XP_002530763.2 translocase of chloroplast 90, chloroplastic isoform X2 [Ricinus communis]